AMTYGNIYVAQVAMGASDIQCVRAFAEAESYDGPSLLIAYANCIPAHGIDGVTGFAQQKLAVQSGAWTLYRFDPRLSADGKNPLQLDSKAPTQSLKDYAYNETRYTMLTKSKPDRAAELIELAQQDVDKRWKLYQQLAGLACNQDAPAQ
ncbi:hypothetical protein LCGC14_3004080, partial [marine sediment metagenome]